jgi:hypothetical protein
MKPINEFKGSSIQYVFYITQVALTAQALDYTQRYN